MVATRETADTFEAPPGSVALTPTPAGREVSFAVAGPEGDLQLTCELTYTSGRVQLIGLSIRHRADGDPETLLELDHAVLRFLKAGQIASTATETLRRLLAGEARSRTLSPAQRDQARQLVRLLDEPQSPRPRGVRPASEHLERVAALYREALDVGGDAARAPSLYVHHALAADGNVLTHNAVRQQIHRARTKGLLPPAVRDVAQGDEVT